MGGNRDNQLQSAGVYRRSSQVRRGGCVQRDGQVHRGGCVKRDGQVHRGGCIQGDSQTQRGRRVQEDSQAHRGRCIRRDNQIQRQEQIQRDGQVQSSGQTQRDGYRQKDSRRQYGNEQTRRNRNQVKKHTARRRRQSIKRFFLCAAGVALCMWMLGIIKGVLQPLVGNLNMAGESVGEAGAVGGTVQPIGIDEMDSVELSALLDELLEKNEETLDYVQSYPDREDYKSQPIDLAEDFTSGEVPLLMQWDKRWGYDAYGKEMIGLAGCGPLCMEMAYLYFTEDTDMTPRDMADFAYENGFYTEQGTSWSLWTEGAAKLGLKGAELSLDENVMKNILDSGHLIVCSMRPGDFTTKGHFILIRGYDEDGFLVNDPNRRSTSGKTWSYEKLQYQIRNLWSLGAG